MAANARSADGRYEMKLMRFETKNGWFARADLYKFASSKIAITPAAYIYPWEKTSTFKTINGHMSTYSIRVGVEFLRWYVALGIVRTVAEAK